MDRERELMVRWWGEVAAHNWQNWRWQVTHGIKDPAKLPADFLAGADRDEIGAVARVYPFWVTPYYLSLVGPGIGDPIRRQSLPSRQELAAYPGCAPDPLGEEKAMPVPGLIHRYSDRCLVLLTQVCAVHCRHCNRKHRWRVEKSQSETGRLAATVDYVARDRQIREVIFSGGDPLMLSDRQLEVWLTAFRRISHVEVLRIGSRVPVVLPMRITPSLCRILKRNRPLWLNTQFNHGREITEESARACEMLLEAGIPVSNQSVLLRGVNDTFTAMRDLLYGLQRISVRPYYLFQCEPVDGVGHFQVSMETGKAIMERIWRECSGLCQPTYVIDTPKGRGKVPLPLHSSLFSGELACYGDSP
jgi:lysine 2,3-aminomutase